jgi:methionine-rich copper-binding protein CopC
MFSQGLAMKRFAIAALAFLSASAALAHSQLTSSTPANGVLTASPAEISLTFTETVNLKFSGITLAGPGGTASATGSARLSQGDKTLAVPIAKPLAPGAYRVDWHVLSNDGHKTKGSFAFTVTP